MNSAHLIRAMRRHLGLSQREMAALAGVSPRSLAGWERGRTSPSSSTLDRLLAAAGLDVVLVDRLAGEDDLALRQHLHRALTQRLRVALGEAPVLPIRATGNAWHELGGLARRGDVLLDGELAIAMWLPVGPVRHPRVRVFHARTALGRGVFDVRAVEGDPPCSAIPFMMEVGERVWVQPPRELAQPEPHSARLRRADELLHAEAPVDDAGRRRPAHRDPNEADEDRRLLRTKTVLYPPDMRDGRGWRLSSPASLAQQLRDGMTG